MKFNTREKKLLQLIKQQSLSNSHKFDHLNRVVEYAIELGRIYKGRREILVAAGLLHDLGRGKIKYRGKKSAEIGAELAVSILKKAGYVSKDIDVICQIIAEHDQPEFHSRLIESRILKDADYLDGFGGRGIMRSIMYAGETGGGIDEAVNRLRKKGRARLKGLELLESKRLGWKLYRFTELFLTEFEKIESLKSVTYSGKFIVLEGISGSGKDTQAELLLKYFENKGKQVLLVNHPTMFLKKLWRLWRLEADDRLSEAFLMMADRVRMVRTEILSALNKGMIVISTRSSVSAQVYQREKGITAEFYRYCFKFEPIADLLIYLDLSAEEALKRTDSRVKMKKEKDRGFFGKKQERQQKLFKKILKNYPNVVKVKAEGLADQVHQRLVVVSGELIG